MRKFKTLKTSWFLSVMTVAVIFGEILRRMLVETFDLRLPGLPVAALCVGVVAVTVSLFYDGSE